MSLRRHWLFVAAAGWLLLPVCAVLLLPRVRAVTPIWTVDAVVVVLATLGIAIVWLLHRHSTASAHRIETLERELADERQRPTP